MTLTRFTGLQYPLTKTHRGTFAKSKGIQQIKADLLQLLLTNPGERCMIPTYGTPLRELHFEPNDTILEQQAKQLILKSINTWEPRVVVKNIEVTSKFNPTKLNISDTGDEINSILGIKIEFVDPENITEIESLVLEVSKAG